MSDFKNTGNDTLKKVIKRFSQENSRLTGFTKLPVFDSRFTAVNQTGHTTVLGTTLGDVNDSGNPNWIMPATATTLTVVSTSAEDGAGTFTGINVIFIDGLGQDLTPLQEVLVLTGTTPAVTVGSFRAMNLSVALVGGIPGSGAVGEITISATTGGQVFGMYLIGDTTGEVGRYTVPATCRFFVDRAVFNGGASCDNTIIAEVTVFGAFPISLGEFYISQGFNELAGGQFLEAGSTIKFRGFTNSGSPLSRKINMSIVGILATVAAWDSLKI